MTLDVSAVTDMRFDERIILLLENLFVHIFIYVTKSRRDRDRKPGGFQMLHDFTPSKICGHERRKSPRYHRSETYIKMEK